MKATGIVRRIDDLGRVVIPKEIRRTLRIREGAPLEIFTDREGQIILKKYSPVGELGTFAGQYADSLAQTSGCLACIADMDQVIAASGAGKKCFIEHPLTRQLCEIVQKRANVLAVLDEKTFIRIVPEQPEEFVWQVISPIVAQGDAVGAVVLMGKEKRTSLEKEQILAACAATFLARQMEQ